MEIFHTGIRRFCSIALGIVFFVAGMLKLMDPVGAGLVIDEYLKFFHMGWMGGASRFIGVAMALIETLTGAALMAGVWRRIAAMVTSILTVGFTLLTLILVIYNPEMDCGCFGEAIHLSHLATFLKNLVLCALCAAAFLPLKDFGETSKRKIAAFALAAIAIVGFCVYSIINLPMIDFTEFAAGASLAADEDEEVVSDGLQMDAENDVKQEIFVIYGKDGKEGAFSLDNLPDSTWTFVRVDEMSHSISDYEESRPLFYISDAYGEYRNELLMKGNVMLVTVYNAEKFSEEDVKEAAKFLSDAQEAGFSAILVSRTMLDVPGQECFTADYKKIITMNRSNGGVTWISDGEIIRKWTASDRPSASKLQELAERNSVEYMVKYASKGRMMFQGIMLYSAAVLLLL